MCLDIILDLSVYYFGCESCGVCDNIMSLIPGGVVSWMCVRVCSCVCEEAH